MNREEILNMKAGRELDALIAQKIMGWVWVEGILAFGHPCLISPNHYQDIMKRKDPKVKKTEKRKADGTFPKYSTDISAAWEIVERIRATQHEIRLRGMEWYDGGGWVVEIMGITSKNIIYSVYTEVTGKNRGDPNPCLPICQAALLLFLRL